MGAVFFQEKWGGAQQGRVESGKEGTGQVRGSDLHLHQDQTTGPGSGPHRGSEVSGKPS